MNEMENKSPMAMDVGIHGLKKHDLKVSTIVFMIFCLVAAGAYGIEEMIPSSGPGLTLLMLMILPFVWGIPFGLVASELGSVRPQEGGYYKWVQEALGEFWGFQAGWWRTISIYLDNTTYVVLAGGYLATQWDLSRTEEFLVKLSIIAVFIWINLRGVRDVGSVSTIISVLVIAAFAAVAVVGFLNWEHNPLIPFTPEPAEGIADWIKYVGAGISIGMWMYSGYESMSTISGEIKDPQVIPKATLITVPLIMAVYIIPTTAGLASMGRWQEWAPDGGVGYATVVTTFVGPAMGVFFVIIAAVAQCSIFNTYIASGSRGFFALADDYLAPPVLVKCDKKRGVPYVAVLSVGIVTLILCMLPFKVLIVADVFLLSASYVMVYISAMILRKRIPREEYRFMVPGGYGFLCFLCAVPITVAFISFLINGTDYFIGGMIGIMTGPIMYIIWRWKYGGLTKKNPKVFVCNTKTGLAVGDLKRISVLFGILAVIGMLGIVFLPWYEADYTSADYFDGLFEGNLSLFAGMMGVIKIATVISALISVFCRIAGWRLEMNQSRKETNGMQKDK
ncbi:MAG: amino acid transporter protein [Bacillota bacterium]|nr:amino acid transporter protein [Bacillota bacterium]